MKLTFHPEVRAALDEGRAVVALESSVIAQGLPPPENLQSALACEAVVRAEGAVPATVAVLDGEIHVGVTTSALERLARKDPGLRKIGARDLAPALAFGWTGGTTVSATCEVAAKAGVRIFATGGIGGVHRGFPETFDVSQDLDAISRWPVAVICAGAKSVLDLPNTLEWLESTQVPVVGVGTHELPAFYTVRSGLELEVQVRDAPEAATLVRARFDALGQGGLVFALPPPVATSLEPEIVERALQEALALAKVRGIAGKAVTPFLLGELGRATAGKSLKANLALLENNARFAAKVARELARGRHDPPGKATRA